MGTLLGNIVFTLIFIIFLLELIACLAAVLRAFHRWSVQPILSHFTIPFDTWQEFRGFLMGSVFVAMLATTIVSVTLNPTAGIQHAKSFWLIFLGISFQ